MSALIYKDWVILSPQQMLPPKTSSCDYFVCGPERDFISLSPETYTTIPLMENLTIDRLKKAGKRHPDRSEGAEFSGYHFLHLSGIYYVVHSDNNSFEGQIAVTGFDLKNLKKGDMIDSFAHPPTSEFLKGVLQVEENPHKVMSYLAKLWPDLACSYYAIPMSVFFEWMKAGAKGWPFQQYPEGVTYEVSGRVDAPTKSVAPKSVNRRRITTLKQ